MIAVSPTIPGNLTPEITVLATRKERRKPRRCMLLALNGQLRISLARIRGAQVVYLSTVPDSGHAMAICARYSRSS